MPRPKGLPKTGGRSAGTPNKLTSTARELMAQFDFDPMLGMIVLANDKDVDVAIRARMYAELTQYVYPKKRAVEHSGPNGRPIEVAVLQEFDDAVAAYEAEQKPAA